ncbi:MAG: signal peptidase II [Rickettsiales bacterium]|nr:signal peptidase II [Rickettsiales bacterium]
MKRLGLLIAIVILVLDQVSKQWVVMDGLQSRFISEVTSFFNLVLVWNRGVSFGMLSNHPEWMPIILTIVALAITAMLLVWLWKAESRLAAISLGFVIGGAIGNIIDRILYGAVVDFLDFHLNEWHWPAFNIADAAIFIGVVLLLIETIIEPKQRAAPTTSET